MFAGEAHGSPHVCCAARLHDQRRVTVDRLTQYATGLVVPGVAGQKKGAAEAVLERLQVAASQGSRCTGARDGRDLGRKRGD